MALILLVEDDADTADWISKQLREAGHVVEVAARRVTAQQLADAVSYDLALVDLNLPDGSGIALIHALRRSKRVLPIIILTAVDADEAMIAGLDAGADDYLVKPVVGGVLLARIRAALRRGGATQMDVRSVGPVSLDRGTRQLLTPAGPVDLSTQEYLLLDFFLGHVGEVVPRSVLQERLWGASFETYTNRTDTAVSRVRRRLADIPGVRLVNVRGVGYRFTVPSAPVAEK
jgi:two-component system copper resistance phosphate regulon response regulator CusR